MQIENDSKHNVEIEKTLEQNNIKSPFKRYSNKLSKPFIAGVLLIIAGVVAILFWIQFFSLDATTLESVINIQQFKEIDPTITPEKLIGFLSTCALIGCILAIFPILGGLLALKRKMWGVSLACSIIGLFTLGLLFISSGLSLIALILLVISKQEFQKKID